MENGGIEKRLSQKESLAKLSKPNPTTSGKPCHAPAGVPQQTKRNSAKVCIGTNAQRPPACVSPSTRVLFKVPAAPHVHDQAAFGWLPRSHVLVSPLPKKTEPKSLRGPRRAHTAETILRALRNHEASHHRRPSFFILPPAPFGGLFHSGRSSTNRSAIQCTWATSWES